MLHCCKLIRRVDALNLEVVAEFFLPGGALDGVFQDKNCEDLFLCVHIWSKLPKMVYKEVLWVFLGGGFAIFYVFVNK